MPMTDEELSNLTRVSMDSIKAMHSSVEDMVVDGSIQGCLAAFRREAYTSFDEAQVRARKVAKELTPFGALGAGGFNGYVKGKKDSNDAYKQGKAKAAEALKSVLNDLQQFQEYRLSSIAIEENFIKKLHGIREELHQLTLAQRDRFHTNSKGGRITQIFDGKKYQILMYRLAELYIFLKEKEQVEQSIKQELAIKYPGQKNDLRVWPKLELVSPQQTDYLHKKEEKRREERALEAAYSAKSQPSQAQMAGAIDNEMVQVEKALEASGKGLALRIKLQAKAEARKMTFEALLAEREAAKKAEAARIAEEKLLSVETIKQLAAGTLVVSYTLDSPRFFSQANAQGPSSSSASSNDACLDNKYSQPPRG